FSSDPRAAKEQSGGWSVFWRYGSSEDRTMRRAIIAIAATAALIGIGQAQTPEANVAGDFVTVQPTDILSYNLIGLNVTNNQNETVGEIKDLVLSNNTLAGYIMSVGGFLGMGEHYVAVSPSAVKI